MRERWHDKRSGEREGGRYTVCLVCFFRLAQNARQAFTVVFSSGSTAPHLPFPPRRVVLSFAVQRSPLALPVAREKKKKKKTSERARRSIPSRGTFKCHQPTIPEVDLASASEMAFITRFCDTLTFNFREILTGKERRRGKKKRRNLSSLIKFLPNGTFRSAGDHKTVLKTAPFYEPSFQSSVPFYPCLYESDKNVDSDFWI
ncbi:hypothetical protein PUN28_006475 [Cardiocondyla obscurior]|uniref:Uncharacterized protein n=1 Tax=Cardiocondyla obscurior TaxID=286306 RepID=A0AAW2GEY1_9HYME